MLLCTRGAVDKALFHCIGGAVASAFFGYAGLERILSGWLRKKCLGHRQANESDAGQRERLLQEGFLARSNYTPSCTGVERRRVLRGRRMLWSLPPLYAIGWCPSRGRLQGSVTEWKAYPVSRAPPVRDVRCRVLAITDVL
jgi:hypothetical protein